FAFDHQRWVERKRLARFGIVAEQPQLSDSTSVQHPPRRPALAPPAPERDAPPRQLPDVNRRTGHASSPKLARESGALRRAPAAARRAVPLDPAAAGSRVRSGAPARPRATPGAAPGRPSPHAIRALRPRI